MVQRRRNVQLHFMVSVHEHNLILEKMEQAGTKNMGAYLRKMAIDGYVIQLDFSDIREFTSLLRYTSNNLNQITKKAHETSSIYSSDLEYLKKNFNRLWDMANEILKRLATLC